MPRGFRIDYQASLIAHQEICTPSGRQPGDLLLTDKRSFISQPKAIPGDHNFAAGETFAPKPHLILYGKDKGPIRAEIFRRNREANGGVNRCWNCSKQVYEAVRYEEANYFLGEWDHIRNKPGERCDCCENGRVSCRACHSERHPRPKFRKM
jgi:hypothetical protein